MNQIHFVRPTTYSEWRDAYANTVTGKCPKCDIFDIMSNEEEADDAGVQDYFFVDDEVDENLLDQRELILLVKNNPALYAKTTKEYNGKGFDKDLAWQTVGSSLTKPLSGPEASKLFYNIRQRFGRERRKVLVSLKGKSGQGTMTPYVPTWLLYEECMFLADHILARKTSSSYSTNALPKSQMAAPVRSNFDAGRASPMFARPSSSPSPPIIRSTPARPSPSPPVIRLTPARPSPSPPVIRLTPARPSPSPSPPVIRSISSPQTSRSSSMWSSDNELFLEDVEADAFDNSQSAAGQSLAATAEEVSSGVSSASESIIQSIKTAKLKGKRTVPLPDNFAVKKKKEDDALGQAILSQTSILSSMTAKLDKDISVATSNNVANSSDISPIMSALFYVLQSVPRERHIECMMELLKIMSEKYVKQ